MDPYPGFELSRLDFPLDDIASLPSYQLALVKYHPLAQPEHHLRAELYFVKRRVAASERGEEFGLEEARTRLRVLERARDALEQARREQRSRMKDAVVQTGGGDGLRAGEGVRQGSRGFFDPVSHPLPRPAVPARVSADSPSSYRPTPAR